MATQTETNPVASQPRERSGILHAVADRPFYTRVALFGTLVYLTAVGVLFIAFAIMDLASLPFGLFFLVPGLVVGAAVAFIRRWGLIVGALGGVFGLLVLSDGADLSLSAPYAFFDFTATLLGLAGCAILLIGSVAGLVESFRRAPKASSSAWELATMRGLASVLVVVAGVSAAATVLNMGSVSAADKQDATIVTSRDVEWDVTQIDARVGQPLKIVIRNDDPILHTFTIRDLAIDIKLGPNSEELVIIQSDRTGVYGFICRVTGHEEDMTGVINAK
jgi:cupredoxin-like protein